MPSLRRITLLATLLLAPLPAAAQESSAPIVTTDVQVLRDSLRDLRAEMTKLDSVVRLQSLPLPTLRSVDVLPAPYRFHDRVYIPVAFQENRVGRVRIQLRSLDGESTPAPVISRLIARDTIEVRGLAEGKRYTGTVEVLAMSRDSAIRGRTVQIDEFTTPARVDRPNGDLQNVVTLASTATVTARSDQPSFFQVLVYPSNEGGGPNRSANTPFGDRFTRRHGAPQGEGVEPGLNRTIPIAGLRPNTAYYLRLVTTNAQGQVDTTDDRRIVTLPREFGFRDAISVQLSAVTGLTVTWSATAPTDSAKMIIPGTGEYRTIYGERVGTDSTTFRAAAGYNPTAGAAAPELTLVLYPRGGGAPVQTKIRVGLEQPSQASLASLSGQQKTDATHLYNTIRQERLPNLDVLMRAGLQLFATMKGGPLGAAAAAAITGTGN